MSGIKFLTVVVYVACALVPPLSAIEIDKRILQIVTGDAAIDQEVAKLQARVRTEGESSDAIIYLGWAFVKKARISANETFYESALYCATLAARNRAHREDALLLRGHVLHAQHEFESAEKIARELTKAPTKRWASFSLLGDVLMEQGKLAPAVVAYQEAIDLRPCLQTYARTAHMRWLKGDLDGAREMMNKAVKLATTRDPEPAAWAYTRLGLYDLQAGDIDRAGLSSKRALQFVAGYPAALLLEGRILLAQDRSADAVTPLLQAAERNPLPEYLWTLLEAAESAGQAELAAQTEARLLDPKGLHDPRTVALFLATRARDTTRAVHLARHELTHRADPHTHDAMAWALFSAGDFKGAERAMRRALVEGTSDPRLFLHAALIYHATGGKSDASKFLRQADSLKQLLLPSEKRRLASALALAETQPSTAKNERTL